MILCGTDLSAQSAAAVEAAGALAKKQGRDLLLVTVLERDDPSTRMSSSVRLERDAGDLRRELGISVETAVLAGAPEERLLEVAKARAASLLVVGAEGESRRGRRLGSVPEHLCQKSEVPVLVARSGDAFRAWAAGSRPLKVLFGSGFGDASTSALQCIGSWPDLSLTVANVAWPYGEHYRLGVGRPMPLDHLRPEVHHQLVGDLARWTAAVPCSSSPKLKVIAGWGRIDAHLAQLASDSNADLLVVGSHQRNFAARMWQGSISRHAIHEATCNVLCVPQGYGKPRVALQPRVVVVPTDFSALADRAVAVGYGLLEPGSTLHLVHVVSHAVGDSGNELLDRLKARVPEAAGTRGIASELKVLEGDAPWLAIWQYASRSNADFICMATHSRDLAGSLVLGSQAQAILQHSRIPVILVPPDRES